MSTDSETKSEAPAEMNYAGFWIRLLAFLIDAVLLSFISWGVANVAYFIGMWAWKGQTLGQMVVNVKVVAADGQRCDLRTAVLRFLGYLLCCLTLGIGFLAIACNRRKRGLHDRIAGTCVIKV